jgi:hypothetical protein
MFSAFSRTCDLFLAGQTVHAERATGAVFRRHLVGMIFGHAFFELSVPTTVALNGNPPVRHPG